VRAQDFLVKHAGKTTDDLSVFAGIAGSADTTNASVAHQEQSVMNKTSKFGLDSIGPVALPNINEKDRS
jgi:hypothetical protein